MCFCHNLMKFDLYLTLFSVDINVTFQFAFPLCVIKSKVNFLLLSVHIKAKGFDLNLFSDW